MLQALHIYIKICRYTKETTFSPSFGELIVHTDLVWDLLIINLKVFQSFFDTDTIPSVSCIFFLFFFFPIGILFHIPLYLEHDGVLSLSSRQSS